MSELKFLPPNATAFERALTREIADEIDVEVRKVVDPDQAPSRFLPFLAAHESVDLWYSDWPEARKRRMIREAIVLASLKGTRAAAPAFLSFVDTDIVDKISFPYRKPVGRIAAGVTPVQQRAFTAHWLLKVDLKAPRRAICVGRTAVGRASLRTVDREPLRRAMRALSVSKAPETAYTADFAHRVPVTMDDGIDLDAGHALGAYHDRTKL